MALREKRKESKVRKRERSAFQIALERKKIIKRRRRKERDEESKEYDKNPGRRRGNKGKAKKLKKE